ncbi:hypothetical protein D9M68_613680 [compost metagenome]
MQCVGKRSIIIHRAVAGRILYNGAKETFIRNKLLMISNYEFNTERLCPCFQDINSLREDEFRNKIFGRLLVFTKAVLHKHGLSSCGTLIQ